MPLKVFKCNACGGIDKNGFVDQPCILTLDDGPQGLDRKPYCCPFSASNSGAWEELKTEKADP